MKTFGIGGVHPTENKLSAGSPIREAALPKQAVFSMFQHIGAPAKPVVKKGDVVKVGTLLGEAGGFVSAPVHSSVSGKVKKIGSYLLASGKTTASVIIESDGNMTPDPSITPPRVESFADLSAAARAAGLVGLGGAGFPTSVKLDASKIDKIDTLILNGAECEP